MAPKSVIKQYWTSFSFINDKKAFTNYKCNYCLKTLSGSDNRRLLEYSLYDCKDFPEDKKDNIRYLDYG